MTAALVNSPCVSANYMNSQINLICKNPKDGHTIYTESTQALVNQS